MADGSMTDLILDRIRFRSTEIGSESESVPRSVRSLWWSGVICCYRNVSTSQADSITCVHTSCLEVRPSNSSSYFRPSTAALCQGHTIRCRGETTDAAWRRSTCWCRRRNYGTKGWNKHVSWCVQKTLFCYKDIYKATIRGWNDTAQWVCWSSS